MSYRIKVVLHVTKPLEENLNVASKLLAPFNWSAN